MRYILFFLFVASIRLLQLNAQDETGEKLIPNTTISIPSLNGVTITYHQEDSTLLYPTSRESSQCYEILYHKTTHQLVMCSFTLGCVLSETYGGSLIRYVCPLIWLTGASSMVVTKQRGRWIDILPLLVIVPSAALSTLQECGIIPMIGQGVAALLASLAWW